MPHRNLLNSPSVDSTTGNVVLKNVTFESAPSSAENADVFKWLSALDEFSGIPANDLKALAQSSRAASLHAGQYIVIEGDEETAHGFILVSGCLAMLKTSVNGKELIVELLQGGDIFGMLLTLAKERLPAQLSARAIQESKVIWMPISNFTLLLKTYPILFKKFVAHLLICLQSSYGLSRGLAHDRVEVRIAAVLSSLAIKFGEPPGKNPVVKFTRQQLADLTGTTPETAIRVTGAMQRDGLIDIKRPGNIRILNLAGLQELVES